MRDTDASEVADRLDEEADELEQRSEELEQRTKDVAQAWQNKRADPNVPGAPPDDDEDSDDDEDDGWDDPDEDDEDEDDEDDEDDVVSGQRALAGASARRRPPAELGLTGRSAPVPLLVDQHDAQQFGAVDGLDPELVGEIGHRRVVVALRTARSMICSSSLAARS